MSWEFGDGITSSQTDPKHTYNNAGTYSVLLSLFREGQVCDTFQKQVKTGSECQPGFTFQTSNLEVTFDITSTGDGTSWWWTFGDGNSTNAKSPTHAYATDGTYNICLYNLDHNNDTCGTPKCISITVSKTVNTAQPTNPETRLYPNPTSRFLHADISLNEFSNPKFYNSLGQEVVVLRQGNAFHLAGLPKGVYLFTFEIDGVARRKIVVKE